MTTLGNGIICANQLGVFRNSFYRDTPHEAQLEVFRISDEEYGKVKFSNKDKRLLATVNLKLSSVDGRVSHLLYRTLP